MSDAHDENNMFAGLLGVGYRWPLVGRLRREVVSADGTPVPPGAPAGSGQHTRYIYPAFAPYAGIATDLVIADVHDLADGIHSGVRYGASGDLFLGATYQRRFFFEARYRLMTEIKSFDFSGLRLSLGYSFRL
jgi:hypothetical protein